MTDLPAQPNDASDEVDDVQPAVEMEGIISSAIELFGDLERERIALQREQQAVTLRSWEVMDNADRRQNETAVKGIESENEQDKRRYSLAIVALSLAIGLPLVLVTFILVVAFFGNERQSQIALDMLRVIGTAVGGGGIIILIVIAVSRFIRR